MKVIKDVAEMQKEAERLRLEGKTIAFVPTMGYLHQGHAALLRKGRELGDVLVLSIFVNPTQFAPTEDLAAYPRDFSRDEQIAAKEGADIIFYPDSPGMYPTAYQTEVAVKEISKPLCGASRPIHFSGVATVCCKLFNIIKPHFAVFGEKDFQQYLVIDRMVRDLNIDMKVVPFQTVREPDGLAMSSRNVYLTPDERKQAVHISRSIAKAVEVCEKGERNVEKILMTVLEGLGEVTLGRIDYVDLRSIPSLESVKEEITGPTLLALAVHFGKARLIDNTVLLRGQWSR
jgi:pantoate--beta-alanine ligase